MMGCLLCFFFVAQLVIILGREESTCSVADYTKGKDCSECSFEIEVDSVKKKGFFILRFTEEGEPGDSVGEEQVELRNIINY